MSAEARTSAEPMATAPASLESIVLEVSDQVAAGAFYRDAFGLGDELALRASQTPTSGFRAFTVSLLVSQPATADELARSALAAGATILKPVKKGLWGYGGVLRAPDGTIWKVATSSKKDTGPVTRQVDEIAVLLGVADVAASKQFYVDRGLSVTKSFGRKYVEFGSSSRLKLALYGYRALAKDAGVPAAGTGSHRIALRGDIGPCMDPDGFVWEAP